MTRPTTLLILAVLMLGAADRSPAARKPDSRPARVRQLEAELKTLDLTALRLAIADLTATYPREYRDGKRFLVRLDALAGDLPATLPATLAALARGDEAACARAEDILRLRREALLANPLLDFDKLLLVRRRPIPPVKKGRKTPPTSADEASGWDIGLPRSSGGNSHLPLHAFDNQIAVLSPVTPAGRITTLYEPPAHEFVGDVDLAFDADRMLFSQRDARGLFQIYEIRTDGTGLRQVTRGDQPDVDNYDACYLPDGGIAFCSTACFQGVPCNKSHVAVLYRANADGSGVRQLCFEQDHDFNPCMLESGRLLYLRWEYSDLPHAHSRILFSMNPDGTGQAEYFHSNSYWPNSLFGARPIPGRPGQVVGIVAGHHGSFREGELVLFDVAHGRHEADGAVQRIPGRGKRVEPIVADRLTEDVWPKFAHPYPLSDKYFLATCKLDAHAPWNLYLVDVFDNLLPLAHVDGYALFEPVPLRKTRRPPTIPPKVDLARHDATVYLADIYRGPGLRGVPRGTVKRLRLLTYHFAYQGMGGLLGVVGMDGPWDIKRVLGTVPVEPDGSALFRVPANTPISLQPLDGEGKALQLMRSWMVGMPGERVSCVGCHEPQSSTPVPAGAMAFRRPASEILPWLGPPRNFSYLREVQPVIDRYCVACHHGRPQGDTPPLVDLSSTRLTSDYRSFVGGMGHEAGGRRFTEGYYELCRYVRRPGIESDLHLLMPLEFHADTTRLVSMLQKGHHGVQLDAESWDRLITWIDLNAPFHGTWTETGWDPGPQRERRRELRKLYAGVDEDPEALAQTPVPHAKPQLPETPQPAAPTAAAHGPVHRPVPEGPLARRSVDLGAGLKLDLVRVPAGAFVMGDAQGENDERPCTRVAIERPFWIGTCEVTNEQFARFDPAHDSHVESKNGYQFGVHGFPVDGPRQPVVRVSWLRARAFCHWLAEKTGEPFALPTEAQWEYACRAGGDSPLWYGTPQSDFSAFANLADAKLREFVTEPYFLHTPPKQYGKYDDWLPKDSRFCDGGLVTVDVGRYRPNAWGLYDMHGNAAEWTRSVYRPYPYDPSDGRDQDTAEGKRVVRGGSWRDLPPQARSASRLAYHPWQGVFNVGFRVVSETP
jgi:formylglycine-generating enzyme required for sulfatase activity